MGTLLHQARGCFPHICHLNITATTHIHPLCGGDRINDIANVVEFGVPLLSNTFAGLETFMNWDSVDVCADTVICLHLRLQGHRTVPFHYDGLHPYMWENIFQSTSKCFAP